MKQLLARSDLRLTKSLGQNFLHDANQLRRIVAAAELTRLDKVLEIGPGLGPLTELLLAEAGEVLTIEKDARLVELLGSSMLAQSKPAVGSPSPWGPRSATRSPKLGHPYCGGLGKPLGWGEGEQGLQIDSCVQIGNSASSWAKLQKPGMRP